MFNTTQRLSWLSSLVTAAFLGFMTLLSGCGGGGASPSQQQPMYVLPDAATVYAYSSVPTTLTIRNGKKPFHVVSSNTTIISFNSVTMPNGTIPDEYIALEGPNGQYGRVSNVDTDTTITLTVFDADNQQIQVPVVVKPSSLNTSLMIDGTAVAGATDGGLLAGTTTYPYVNSGTQATASVRATTITGGPVIGHKIRFRVMDQGAKYGFVCQQSLGDCLAIETDSAGHVITVETTTDRNGDAYAILKADANTSTQYATIAATDQATGHTLRGQFIIVGQALTALPSAWTVPDTIPAVAATATLGVAGAACPAATRTFSLFGGYPPYTIYINDPAIATITGATASNTFTVYESGNTFSISTLGGTSVTTYTLPLVPPAVAPTPANPSSCGTATFTVRDSAGTTSTITVTNTANNT